MKYGVRLVPDDTLPGNEWALLELPDQVVLVVRESAFTPANVAEGMAAVAAGVRCPVAQVPHPRLDDLSVGVNAG